jgi:hypothetical protein
VTTIQHETGQGTFEPGAQLVMTNQITMNALHFEDAEHIIVADYTNAAGD